MGSVHIKGDSMKRSIVIYDSWGVMIKNLPAESAGLLIKMICEYSFEGSITPSGNEHVDAMFAMIKEKLDEDAESYEETKKSRSKAGKAGMEKRWKNNKNITKDNKVITNDNTVITNDNNATEDITKITVSVSDSVSVSDKDKELIVAGYFNDPKLDKSFSDYVEMRMRMNAPVDFQRTQKKLYDMAKGDKDVMIAILEQSIQQGWKGLYEIKSPEKKNKFKQFEERDYDMDELERELLEKQRRTV